MRVNVTTTDGTRSIVVPTVPTLRPIIGTRYAETFARPKKVVDESDDAVNGDQFKWIWIDATNADVTYTIDPAMFTGLTLHIRAMDATFNPIVAADSGVIVLTSQEELTSITLQKNQPIYLYSDGTNLIEV